MCTGKKNNRHIESIVMTFCDAERLHGHSEFALNFKLAFSMHLPCIKNSPF